MMYILSNYCIYIYIHMDNPNNIFEPINELDTNSNYFDRYMYRLDVLITFILCIVFFWV